ncbi:hypothetical protein Q9233_012576 [Columba guinea]|nr:hypothetical protein Q9233_012576 [Columba guinea]
MNCLGYFRVINRQLEGMELLHHIDFKHENNFAENQILGDREYSLDIYSHFAKHYSLTSGLQHMVKLSAENSETMRMLKQVLYQEAEWLRVFGDKPA